MKKIILLIVASLFPCLSFAKSDLSKKEKAIVKSLKKQYKLESVEIERSYDGFVYYQLLTKDFKRMIADSTRTRAHGTNNINDNEEERLFPINYTVCFPYNGWSKQYAYPL